MMALETERAELEAAIAGAQDEPGARYELRPNMPEIYAGLVAELQATLAELGAAPTRAQRQLIDAVRGLIDRIEIRPLTQERGGPIDLVLYGTLASLLGLEPNKTENMVLSGSWGRARTADLWVMNPPL